jgi:hypothetical protein
MFTRSASAGEFVGSTVGKTVVTANTTAKAAVLASACFVRGFRAGWLRATRVTPQQRSTAEARLALVCIKEVA